MGIIDRFFDRFVIIADLIFDSFFSLFDYLMDAAGSAFDFCADSIGSFLDDALDYLAIKMYPVESWINHKSAFRRQKQNYKKIMNNSPEEQCWIIEFEKDVNNKKYWYSIFPYDAVGFNYQNAFTYLKEAIKQNKELQRRKLEGSRYRLRNLKNGQELPGELL